MVSIAKIIDVKWNDVLYRETQLHLIFILSPANRGRVPAFFPARWVCVTLNGSFYRSRFSSCISVAADAQVTTSTLVGLVRDAQNAVIPGATVVATHEGTGVSREGVSDANGEFVFSALPAGPYTVKIELTGFKTLAESRHAVGRRPDRASDVHARSRRVGGNGHGRRRSAAHRDRGIAAGRQPRIAGSARAASQPPQPDEPDEPDGRRQRRAATAWCR